MAITKGKTTRRRTAHRASGKVGSSVQVSKAIRSAKRPVKRNSGSWDTQKWLIGKKLAHVVKEKLIADFRKGESSKSAQKARKQRIRR